MASSSSTADSTSRHQTRKKYKDSCNNCAASKVKCNRDKPQCSRCEDRGLTCFYSLSQRSGRRPTASQQVAPVDTKFKDNDSSKERLLEDDSDNVSSKQRKISSDEYASTTKSDYMDFTTFPAPSAFSPETFGHCDFSSMTPWGFPAAAPNSNTATPQGVDVDPSYMDYFPELLDDQTLPWLTDTSSGTSLHGNSLESSDGGIFSGVAGLGKSLSTAFSTQTTPSSVSSLSRRSCCSTRASELYKQIRVQGSKCCVKEQPSQPETKAVVVSFEDVINTNRECINNIIDMLDCPCSAVQQTVIIISMIVFEVLDRYHTTALECAKGFACMVPNGQSPNKQGLRSSKYAIEGPDARYMRISCILGELHLVVRLMELLSRRSKGYHESDSLMHDLAGKSPVLATKSISASVFVQVEADMRKRLSTVRESLISLMRQT